MKKKLVFIAFVLCCSLAFMQYVAMDKVFDDNQQTSTPLVQEHISFQPVKTEVYSVGEYIVIKKDGKYQVFEKNAKSI